MAFPGGTVIKNPPANAGDAREEGLIPSLEDPLGEEMATHSGILAWEIPWTGSLGVCSLGVHKESDTTE